MKPIIRWTVGNVPKAGLLALKYSIEEFYNLYQTEFDYYLLFNSDVQPQLNFKFLNFINQKDHINSLPYPPKKHAWKLYPPRLNIATTEVFIDNDLIIYKRMPQIETLLEKGIPFITEDVHASFGNYADIVPKNLKINSGFFGLPKNIDFKDLIIKNAIHPVWDHDWDEQGLMCKIMSMLGANIISLSQISISMAKKEVEFGSHGCHFVLLNRPGYSWNERKGKPHINWDKYIDEKKKKIKKGSVIL